jgi:hypothetical protein
MTRLPGRPHRRAHGPVAYDRLLAPDFRFVQGEDSLNRHQDLALARGLFGRAVDLTLTFGDGYEVVEGPDADTWTLRNLSANIVVIEREDGKKHEVQSQATELVVRRVAEPVPHFEITRWSQPAEVDTPRSRARKKN